MDGMAKIQKELLEVKKLDADSRKEKEPREDLTEIALFLENLDSKIKRLEREDTQFKEELAEQKTKKVQLREKLTAQDEEYQSLQVDLEYLNKENSSVINQVKSYEEKVKQCNSYCIAPSDLDKISRDKDKTNILRHITGIKFVGFPQHGSEVEGLVYNDKNSRVRKFKINKDENDGKLWKLIREVSHADWTHMESKITEEMLQKR